MRLPEWVPFFWWPRSNFLGLYRMFRSWGDGPLRALCMARRAAIWAEWETRAWERTR